MYRERTLAIYIHFLPSLARKNFGLSTVFHQIKYTTVSRKINKAKIDLSHIFRDSNDKTQMQANGHIVVFEVLHIKYLKLKPHRRSFPGFSRELGARKLSAQSRTSHCPRFALNHVHARSRLETRVGPVCSVSSGKYHIENICDCTHSGHTPVSPVFVFPRDPGRHTPELSRYLGRNRIGIQEETGAWT